MSEIESAVFDLVSPSPATLQDLSAIAISIQLWRQEIDKYRKNGTWFYELPLDLATFKDAIPNIPSSLFSLIKQYVKTLGSSINSWKFDHSSSEIVTYQFMFNNFCNKRYVLSDFDDFVCDFDGSIDNVKTARRMMTCDRISNEEKFKIACKYCFVNDIKRIWPSVSEKMDPIDFDSENPPVYYWICYLNDELFKTSSFLRGVSVEERMLEKSKCTNWSWANFFWNRLNFENQRRIAKKIIDPVWFATFDAAVFARYLLAKCDELLIDELIAEKGASLIESLLYLGRDKNTYVIPVWMYIKNRIDERNFIQIIQRCLKSECEAHDVDSENYKATFLYMEIWKTASNNLKRSVIENLILKNEWIETREDLEPNRDFTFLSTILSYASLEERNVFWRKKWSDLIVGAQSTNLNRLMNLCFEHDDDICEFKRTVMTKYENIGPYCVRLLEENYLEKIGDFLNFCCSDIETRRNLKQQLLQSNFLGDESILEHYHLSGNYSLTDFINDAYAGADDLAADFKSRLFGTPAIVKCLIQSIESGDFSIALDLLKMSSTSEPVAAVFRDTFLNGLKRGLIECSIRSYAAENLQEILLRCLGSEEKVTEFKKTLRVEEIFQNMVQQEELKPAKEMMPILDSIKEDMFEMMTIRENFPTEEDQVEILVRRYPRNLNQFLNWYFNNPEDIAEFKEKFSDVFATFIQRDENLDILHLC